MARIVVSVRAAARAQAFARDFPIDDQRRVRRGFDTPILFGAVTSTRAGQPSGADRYPYNTALMMNGAGDITGTYDKVFLMLFGEYIPFYDAIPWFTDLFPEASNFNRGNEPASFPLRRRRPRLPAGTAHLLRGHPARLRPPRRQAGARTRSSTSPTTPGSGARPSPISTWRWRCSARSSTAWR